MTARLACALLVAACGSRHGSPRAGEPSPLPPPLLPGAGGRFAPGQLDFAGQRPPTGAQLTDLENCGSCHPDVFAQWQGSAHALASFSNPIYRVAVDRLRSDVGTGASRMCGACHDVSLLVDGAMDRDVDPADPRAHAGVTCRMCHGVAEVTPDGNGSTRLTWAPIPIPASDDPGSTLRHKARVALPPLRTAALCATCHRAFLDQTTGNVAHLTGQDDATPWQRSAFSGNTSALLDEDVPARDCRGCHMPLEDAVLGDQAATDGKVASHRVLGGHTWLSAMRGDAATLARAQAALTGVATIDVAAAIDATGARTLPAEGAPVRPGETLALDVVVRNLLVGHRFPGGTMDAQDTWIEVTVHRQDGALLAASGVEHEAGGAEPGVHVLRAAVAGQDGVPLAARETHLFRATVWNHTLAPREATAVRYTLAVPAELPASALPLRVNARLRHRTRNLALAQAACDDHRSPRGQRFAAAATAAGKANDPCVAQPITDVAVTEAWLGEGWQVHASPAPATRATWLRLWEHALALSHSLQERVGDARPSLDAAWALVEHDGTRRARAMVLALQAQVSARQGRTAEALAYLDRAAAEEPGHPALDRIRGEALTQVWRWRDALPALRAVAEAAPGDYVAWMNLALAAGSAGEPREALDAARAGLLLQPRDHDLLRAQALALDALGAPDDVTQAALDAYLARRPPDDAPAVRGRCSKKVPGCANERNPVHVHALAP